MGEIETVIVKNRHGVSSTFFPLGWPNLCFSHYSHSSTTRPAGKPGLSVRGTDVESMNDKAGSANSGSTESSAQDVTRLGSSLPPARYFTVAEVAATVRLSKMSVYRLIHSGQMEAVQFGRSFRIAESALNDYLAGSFYDVG